MNKQQLLDNLKQTYCRIGKSGIEGVGVFAIRTIPRAVNPFPGSFHGGYMQFTENELDQLDPIVKKMITDFFVTENGITYVPSCGLNGIDVSFFMNHSHHPNVVADASGENFSTLRQIETGEELTISYDQAYGPGQSETVKENNKP